MANVTRSTIFTIQNRFGEEMTLDAGDAQTVRDSLVRELGQTGNSSAVSSENRWMAAALEGRKIDAIKLLREKHGPSNLGLKEAKDVVEAFLSSLGGTENQLLDTCTSTFRLVTEADVNPESANWVSHPEDAEDDIPF